MAEPVENLNRRQSELHRVEAEAIALALELRAKVILLDEAEARLKAQQLGLAHTGALGVLQRARTLNVEPNGLKSASVKREDGPLR